MMKAVEFYMRKKTLMIDLDGVLNTYNGLYEENYISPIRDAAAEFLKTLSGKFSLVLFTSRDTGLAQKWIDEHNVGRYFAGITNVKKPSYLIIDDRCVRFNGDFGALLEDINNFRVWYKD